MTPPAPRAAGPPARPRVALVSDIHANLPALEAVLADIGVLGLRDVWCLGDVVGYGSEPVECARLVRERCQAVLRGNHDAALAPGGGRRFHRGAREAIGWTRGVFSRGGAAGAELARWLLSRPPALEVDGVLLAHGSPRDPEDEYLQPEAAADPSRMAPQWPKVRSFAFVGHTHVPGVFERGRDAFTRPPDMLGGRLHYLSREAKGIVNVGSVGQPRDGDARACYAVFDGETVAFRRVAYDARETRRRILLVPSLAPFLGDRLLEGL